MILGLPDIAEDQKGPYGGVSGEGVAIDQHVCDTEFLLISAVRRMNTDGSLQMDQVQIGERLISCHARETSTAN